MRDLLKVLLRVLATEFYRLNTGFFLVIIALAFGFMSDVEHVALAGFFISGFLMTLIPIVIWGVYLLKIALFNRSQLMLPQNDFLFEAALLKHTTRFSLSLLVIVVEFVPALTYGAFLALIAYKGDRPLAVAEIAIAETALVISGALALSNRLCTRFHESSDSIPGKIVNRVLARPLPLIEFEWLIRNHPLMVTGTKIFAGVLLFGVCRLYAGEAYDIRLLGMAAVIAFSGNFLLLRLLHQFSNSDSLLLRNMPMPRLLRLADFIIVFVVLCLPESIILFKNFPYALENYELPLILVFGWSIGLLIFSSQFISTLTATAFKHFVFGLIILSIVMILSKQSLLLLSMLNITASLLIFYRNYYRFEVLDR